MTGDELTIDVDTRRLDVALSDEEIAARVSAYIQPPRADEHVDVAIQKYAKLVGSAVRGRRCALRGCYSSRNSLSSALNAAGRSIIAM